ncbi:OmpA family protein [Rhizobium herbae]|uniref:Outer membrane protein OmpA-like peptidoglycan-associated protein n=1 Tax=Rhizobium herbae TaxID=508661 RepID=A0ABS4EGM4_9HYPH|nr:OmpA family protein [Rhizobium herbae]MBP1857092.1 outer membrane protein OmpA-like peptidoglycan-associated protein [Rhizobium herbae]
MSIRSKLFATVAFPMLSMSIAIQPALADSLMKPFEVAQENGVAQPDGGEPTPEELLRKKRKQRAEQTEEQPAQEEQPSRAERRKKRQDAEQQQEPQQEAQPAQEEQPSRAERKKRQQAEQQQEAQPAQEEQPSRAERKKRQQAEQQQEEAQPSADDDAAKAAEEKIKARAERKKRQQAEQQQEEAQPSTDDDAAKAADEKAKARAERKKRQQAEQQPEEVQPSTDDDAAKAAADEKAKARAERKKRQDAEQPQQEEAQPSTGDDDAQKAAEERRRIRAEQKARAQSETQGQQPVAEDELRPAVDGDGQSTTDRKRPDRRKPIPKVVDTRTEEEKQIIARDPSKSDDTVVLPVDNGAAVLDSDKDADNADGNAREKRRKQRERARADDENVEVPKSDEEAQSRRKDRRPTREELGAGIKEEGRRVDRAPEFGVNELIDAFTGADRRRPRIDETRDNRTVLDFGDQIIVRGDDRPRLRRNAQETFYEELSRGRSRETIERPNGVRIVTIYNRYGDIIQRSRIDRDGREYLMIYAPEAGEGPRPPSFDAGDDLPPMRLRVPVRDYIIDTSSEPDRDYYDFLAEPPVEQVERTYTIDEVRNSARIRDKVRRIDLDTITFATGSAEVPLSQAKTLRKVADAMLEVIEKDPGETFFIEGHTDAVGGDEPNLVLSDERAESVASLLTEVYDIPAENLVTQGYGERFLKVRTLEAEQQNRRVTIRRVTPLVRPVAQN